MKDEAEDALDFLLRSMVAERNELYRYQRRQTEKNRQRWENASEALGAAKYRARGVIDDRKRASQEEIWEAVMKARA